MSRSHRPLLTIALLTVCLVSPASFAAAAAEPASSHGSMLADLWTDLVSTLSTGVTSVVAAVRGGDDDPAPGDGEPLGGPLPDPSSTLQPSPEGEGDTTAEIDPDG